MTYEYKQLETDSLIPYVNNSRLHSDDQVLQIASSIKEFGFTNPILIDEDNGVIAGHGRIMAAKKLNLETVPCIVMAGLTEAQKKAYVIADNQLALNSDWDIDKLKLEVATLDDLDFNVDLLGFDNDFLESLREEPELLNEGLIEDDHVPDAPEEPITKLGDVWLLGDHRLMCGDSTMIDDVEKLMNGKKADMVFTDPPYNIDFKPQRGTHNKILNDNLGEPEFIEFLHLAFSNCLAVMNKDTYLITFMGWSTIHNFKAAIDPLFKIKSMPVWVKNNFGIGYYTRPQYEPFFLCLNGDPIKPEKAPSDVFSFSKVNKTIHSCEKPVDLIIGIIDYFNRNGLFYEPFGGSGSTLIACEKTNRKCYTMELDTKYCDVIINRWQDFTGKKAILESNNQTYEDIKNACSA